MARISEREYQLTSALMQADKRCNTLLKDNEKLNKWIVENNNEIDCLKRKIAELEGVISEKLMSREVTKKPTLALKR